MDSERWQRLQAALTAATQCPAAERPGLIERICADDPVFRAELESLLHEWEADPDFLEPPTGTRLRSLESTPSHDASKDPLIGSHAGSWTVVRRIDHGGMGSVYLGERVSDDFTQYAALKVIARGMNSDSVISRFHAERRILAALTHPNIAPILDGGITQDGRPWFAMPYLEGALPLDRYCSERQLPLSGRLELLQQVCSAVQFAHQNRVVHRDLKPSNIMVTPLGVPMLLDFGIAKLLDRPDDLTGTANRLYTPQYASPEQRAGTAITTASDVYQLGLLLHLLLCGVLPATTAPDTATTSTISRPSEQVSEGHAETCSETVDSLRKRVRGDLDTICLQALYPDPQRRYRSAEAFAEDLSRSLSGLPVSARADTFAYRAGKFLRRNRWSSALAATLFLFAIGFGLFASVAASRIATQAETVSIERDRAQATARFLTELFTYADPTRTEHDYTAEEMLGRGLALLHKDKALRDNERAAVLTAVGGVYQVRGDYENASSALREAVAIGRRSGISDLTFASSLLELSKVELRLEHHQVSERLARESLAILDVTEDVAPEERASVLSQISLALHEQNRLQPASEILEEVIKLRRSLPGAATDQNLSSNLNNLGLLYADLGQLDRAEAAYSEALEIVEQRYGPVHPYGAFLRRSRSGLHELRGNVDLARRDLEDALSISEQTLGEDHPFVVDVRRMLAELSAQEHQP